MASWFARKSASRRHWLPFVLIAYVASVVTKHLRHTASSGSLIPDYNNVSPAVSFFPNSLASSSQSKDPGGP